jgi:N-dimethylarginine dimethylaminohydrolase
MEFDGIVDTLQKLGVTVIVLESQADDVRTTNMIYLRDVAMAFQDKLVLANMKHPVRSSEPSKFQRFLTRYHKSFQNAYVKLDTAVSMEGADMFVIGKKLIYAYVGSRTSPNVAQCIEEVFPETDIRAIEANIHGIPQHILGGVHIVGEHTATRRIHYCRDNIEEIKFIDFEESNETSKGFSLNIVTIGPHEILMPAGNPTTKRTLESHGIICHEVAIQEIHKMGGGLACMVLPLWREN